MRNWFLAFVLALTICGCSKSETKGLAKDPAEPEAIAANGAGTADTVAMPQIAYTYGYDVALPWSRIPAMQTRHLALCRRLGSRCHVVTMEQDSGDHRARGASLELAVAAAAAPGFGDTLVRDVEANGGETTGRAIQGEDLSKRIVDVEARLRGRQALADRLLDVVQTHRGGIADLVAAEKALADVQQEIDTARAELTEARGRVAMSAVRIAYRDDAGFSAPVADSVRAMASTAGTSLATVLTVLAAVVPVLIAAWAAGLAYRAARRRWTAAAHPVDSTEPPS